jgi:hypothetical protein
MKYPKQVILLLMLISCYGLSVKAFCYPNPINDKGMLYFNFNTGGKCEIRLFDISGGVIKTLADLNVQAGEQQVGIDAKLGELYA